MVCACMSFYPSLPRQAIERINSVAKLFISIPTLDQTREIACATEIEFGFPQCTGGYPHLYCIFLVLKRKESFFFDGRRFSADNAVQKKDFSKERSLSHFHCRFHLHFSRLNRRHGSAFACYVKAICLLEQVTVVKHTPHSQHARACGVSLYPLQVCIEHWPQVR